MHKVWVDLMVTKQSVLVVNMLDAREMGRNLTRSKLIWQSDCVSEMAQLVFCSRSAVVRIYQQLSEEGQVTNRLQCVGHPRLTDAQGQQRLTQVTHNFSDGHGRNVSQHSVHHNLLWRECYGLGNVLLENPAIHVDTNLTCDTYLNIVADQVNPFMTIVFPGGSGLFRQDNPAALFRKALKNIVKWSRCFLGFQIPKFPRFQSIWACMAVGKIFLSPRSLMSAFIKEKIYSDSVSYLIFFFTCKLANSDTGCRFF